MDSGCGRGAVAPNAFAHADSATTGFVVVVIEEDDFCLLTLTYGPALRINPKKLGTETVTEQDRTRRDERDGNAEDV